MFTNKPFTILIVASSWFVGSLFSYYLQPSAKSQLLLLLLTLFVGLLIAITRNIPRKRLFRIATVFFSFFFAGSLSFHLNDYRLKNGHPENAFDGTFSVHVLESNKSDFQSQNLVVQCTSMESKGLIEEADFKFIVRIQDPEEYFSIDDELVLEGEMSRIGKLNNPGEFNAEWYYLTKGITHQMFVNGHQTVKFGNVWSVNGMFLRWRNFLAKEMEKHLDGDFLGVSKALLLGDKSDLEKDVMNSFTNTGSMHVLAVSGLHVGLLLYVLNFILLRFSRILSKRQALLISILFIWCYGLLTGGSPAVMRAVFMFTILAFGGLFERKSSGLISLLATALFLSVLDPWVMFDIGFQLSFLAMLGIFLLYPKIHRLIVSDNKIVLWFWEGTAVGLAATAFTTPLTLFYFYQFPNYFLIANVGVMLFGFLVLLFGMIFLFTSFIPVVSAVATIAFSFTILGLLLWVNWVDQIPGAVSGGFHISMSVLIVSLCIVLAFSLDYKKKKPGIPLSIGVVVIVCILSYNRTLYFNSGELIFLNGKELVIVLKTPEKTIAFYEPRYGHVNTIPRSLVDFERYSGQKAQIVSLNFGAKAQFKSNALNVSRTKEGWLVKYNRREFFYQTYGVPRSGKNVILNARLQKYLHPDDAPKLVSLKIY